MKTIKYLSYMVLSTFVLSVMTSCEPKALTQDDVFLDPASLDEILAEENPEGYKIYNLNDFNFCFLRVRFNNFSNEETSNAINNMNQVTLI